MNESTAFTKLPFSLPDSALKSYQYIHETNKLIVIIELWNAKDLELHFADIILFTDNCFSNICSMIQVDDRTDIMDNALKRVYEVVPANHPYKHYQFLTDENKPVIEIICDGFEARMKTV